MFKLMRKFLFGLVVLVALAIIGVFWYEVKISYQIKQDTKIVITEGEGVSAIAADLAKNNLIKSELAFKVYIKLNHKTKLLAGDYIFKAGNNLKDIVKRLARGEADFQEKNILIKEGMNLKEINDYLVSNQLIKGDCNQLFAARIKNLPPEFKRYAWLREVPQNTDLEGYLFPDTYRVFSDATCEDLLIKMLNNFESKVSPEFGEIKRQNKTLFEILTMASILEKEVRTPDDMALVSGVFWRRMANGQRLESDATLAYVLGGNKPAYSLKELETVSPYNTYRNDGLPPTPIDNPGLVAIRSAIYPKASDYNYFLSRPDTGETIFSKTFAEHKLNKAKYLK